MTGDLLAADCAEGYSRAVPGVYNYECDGTGVWNSLGGKDLDCQQNTAPGPSGIPQGLLDKGLTFGEIVVIVFVCGIVLAAAMFGVHRRFCAKNHWGAVPSVLRESFLGSSKLPESQLADKDVEARWQAAASCAKPFHAPPAAFLQPLRPLRNG